MHQSQILRKRNSYFMIPRSEIAFQKSKKSIQISTGITYEKSVPIKDINQNHPWKISRKNYLLSIIQSWREVDDISTLKCREETGDAHVNLFPVNHSNLRLCNYRCIADLLLSDLKFLGKTHNSIPGTILIHGSPTSIDRIHLVDGSCILITYIFKNSHYTIEYVKLKVFCRRLQISPYRLGPRNILVSVDESFSTKYPRGNGEEYKLSFSILIVSTNGGSWLEAVLKTTPVRSLLSSHLFWGNISKPKLWLQTPHRLHLKLAFV